LVASARAAADNANDLMTGKLPDLIDQADAAAGAIEKVAVDVGGKADKFVVKLDSLADVAIARLNEAEETLTKANATLTAIETVSRDIDTIVTGEGAALVIDARNAVKSATAASIAASKVIEEDVPLIVADVRAATASANALFKTLDTDLTAFTGRLDGLAAKADTVLVAATDTFANANRTLDAVTGAMGTAEGALVAAEKTFNGVNQLIDEDIDALLADARKTMASLEKAVSAVADDLPLITADVRATLTSANSFVRNLDAILIENRTQIDAFMRAGLPQFVRFTQEARSLVENLQRVTQKLERDPARFILGTQSPEFRR